MQNKMKFPAKGGQVAISGKKTEQIKIGKIISNKMRRTLIVEVKRLKLHPLYKKQIILTKKYHVHCQDVKKYHTGKEISIKQCRPYAKTVNWEVVDIKKEKL